MGSWQEGSVLVGRESERIGRHDRKRMIRSALCYRKAPRWDDRWRFGKSKRVRAPQLEWAQAECRGASSPCRCKMLRARARVTAGREGVFDVALGTAGDARSRTLLPPTGKLHGNFPLPTIHTHALSLSPAPALPEPSFRHSPESRPPDDPSGQGHRKDNLLTALISAPHSEAGAGRIGWNRQSNRRMRA